jgi:hypothetical protein
MYVYKYIVIERERGVLASRKLGVHGGESFYFLAEEKINRNERKGRFFFFFLPLSLSSTKMISQLADYV